MSIFWHFTAPTPTHLGSILEDGRIHTTESNVSQHERHAGPRVVWLTDDPDPAHHVEWAAGVGMVLAHSFGHTPAPSVKLGARIAVELPKRYVLAWRAFAREHDVDRTWRRHLERAGGGGEKVARWFVYASPIPRARWREVTIFGSEPERDFTCAGADLLRLRVEDDPDDTTRANVVLL